MFDAPHELYAGKMVSDELFGFGLVLTWFWFEFGLVLVVCLGSNSRLAR